MPTIATVNARKKTAKSTGSTRRETTPREAIEAVIRSVPRGRVSTYGAVAQAVGRPGAARLVAQILRYSMGLPWHRILGAGGVIKLRGESADEQRSLLIAEGVTLRGQRVTMRDHEHRFRARSPIEVHTKRTPKR